MALRLFVVALLIGYSTQATAVSPIVISSDEVWDGILNPRAGDGVGLAGGVYTIPHELQIGSGATLFLNDSRFEQGATPTGPITFDFTGAGGLTFDDATSTIDVHNGDRFGPVTTFTLNMQNNDILGFGQILNGPVAVAETGKAMYVAINSLASVSLGTIDISKKDASLANLTIIADGSITIDSLSTSDVVDGGASAGNILIKGQSITIGDIDTTTQRLDGQADNGNISLIALDPPTFDPGNALGNDAAENLITLTGTFNTNGPAINGGVGPNLGGNVDLTAVKVVLDSGFSLDLGENATDTINAGVVGGGFSASDLFMDVAGSGLSASHTVEHFIPEPSTLALLFCGGLAFVGRRRR